MDFITDQSCRYVKLFDDTIGEVPEVVKQASLDPADIEKLNRNQFADPAKREFPIDEPGHVLLSYGYLKLANVARPDLECKVKRAAKLLGIEGEILKIDTALAETEKSASVKSETVYAVEIDFEGHEKLAGTKGFYPINDSVEIAESAQRICNERNRMPVEVFVCGCREIVKAARAKGCHEKSIPATVWAYGDEHMVDYDHVYHQAQKRASLTDDPIYKDISQAAAEDLDEVGIDKYVELWRQADRQNGIEGKPGIKEAHLVFYSGISKKAFDEKTQDWCVVHDAPVPKQAFAAIPVNDLQKLFPQKDAEQLTELVKRAKVEDATSMTLACNQLRPELQKALLGLALKHA